MSEDRDSFVERAKSADIRAVAEAMGAKLKKAGAAELAGPCPVCGGSDRFSVNTRERVFNCRGFGGGGVIDMAAHIQGLDPKRDFIRICEAILDESAPDRDPKESARQRDPAIDKERKEERRDEEIARREQEAAEKRAGAERAERLFSQGRPIELTAADDYLERRGIFLHTFSTADLRFVHNLSYRGFVDSDSQEEVELGVFDCMLAAMRAPDGSLQGVHRTYLDPAGPMKLRPPGDRKRNKAKKGAFRMGGGLILLSEPAETLAVAEGIETACSWRAMARDGEFGEAAAGAAIAAAYSLGNMCGSATGTKPHPRPPRGHANATIPNGDPDMSSGAMWVPAGVRRLILIGDGDSDPAMTRAMLATGAERFRRLGLEVLVHLAPDGSDWNDVLLSRRQRAAA
jgi:hypothetical protein